jgi:NADPH:quinone reductase-like Zn-dependent oxidoreductase
VRQLVRVRKKKMQDLMKAIAFDRYGGNEVLQVKELPVPLPGTTEVIVAVRAASVNPVDWKVRYGMTRIFTGSTFPKVLGCECAGEVVGTGRSVTAFRKGDAVVVRAGVRRLGAFAEYACADVRTVWPKPAALSFEDAACLPIAGLTALQSLRDHGRIAPGARVLINGASGGVGHFAVQIAKVLGAEVTGVCSGRSADFVKGLGADRVIDYQSEDFTRGAERYDIVLDAVSSSSFRECRKVLAPRGIYVSTLPNRTVIDQIITTLLPGKKARSMWVRADAEDMAWLAGRVAEGRIRVFIEKVFPLDQAREALAYSETGRARGKIVLKVS